MEQRADLCASAEFGIDSTGIFALISCSSWLDLGKVDHNSLGICRTSTGVWPDGHLNKGVRNEAVMSQEIGIKCTKLCINCPRFSPKQIPVDTADVEVFLTSIAGA